MNDIDLYLEVELRLCQPLRYIQRSLSRKPLEIEAWFQRTTNRKWPMGYQMWCEAVRSAILATAWLLDFIFLLFLLCHYAVNWCDKLRVCIYICCFIAGFSYRTRLVIKQSWSHSHTRLITARWTLVQSAVLRSHVVCLSVCPSVRPSVTLVDCDHI